MSRTTQIPRIGCKIKGGHQPILSSMIVLVGGLPGTGKTFFASRLSEKLRATYINSDLARKEIDSQGRYAFEDKLTVYEEMAQRAAEVLRHGKVVVVDATFYRRQMRQIFFTLAKLMHLKAVFIEIIADEKVVRERLRRTKAPGRAGLSVHNLVRTQYEQPDVDHLVIESTHDNIEEMLENARGYISNVYHRTTE